MAAPVPSADVFTSDDARAFGMSASALHCALVSGRVQRVRRGVYCCGDPADPRVLARAAALAYPEVTISHVSAARLRSVPVVGRHPNVPEVTTGPRTNANLPGIHPYRARLREHEIETTDGLRVTSAARTVVDIARHYPVETAVAAIDFVLHEELATPEAIADSFEFTRSWPGGIAARRALLLCDSRAESPLESISRLAIRSLGLPEPECQTSFYDADGVFVGRSDFAWGELRTIGEADGLAKYGGSSDMEAQNDRGEGLDGLGLVVTRWGWARAWRERPLLGARLRSAFERGVERDRAGLPRRWTAIRTPRVAVL